VSSAKLVRLRAALEIDPRHTGKLFFDRVPLGFYSYEPLLLDWSLQMSFAQTFTDDVFISYRHLDNELHDDQGKGWIDNFHERFESVLGEALGYEPLIWRDPRLPGNVYFADVLEERIRNTAVMISILSPGAIFNRIGASVSCASFVVWRTTRPV
jgi:hypothetical protein